MDKEYKADKVRRIITMIDNCIDQLETTTAERMAELGAKLTSADEGIPALDEITYLHERAFVLRYVLKLARQIQEDKE